MVVGGFWHGANWTFVAWGALNGIFLSLEKFIDDRGWGKPFDKIPRPIKPIYSFMVFLLGAIFFRSETISKSFISFGKIFTLGDGKFTTELLSLSIWIPISILIFIEITEEARIQNTLLEKMNWQLFKTPVFIALFVVYLMIYTVVSSPQFYYFQF
jgi:alginate O-acetyltransferase complex protein AlgI